MKTRIFELLLNKLAKQLMTEAEYQKFRLRIWMHKWQEFRRENPNLWEWFSEKYEEARGLFTPNSTPEEVLFTVVPGPITHYPEIFRPFMQDLTIPGSTFSGYALNFSGVDLSGIDTTGIDLSEIDISGIDENIGGTIVEVFKELWELIFE